MRHLLYFNLCARNNQLRVRGRRIFSCPWAFYLSSLLVVTPTRPSRRWLSRSLSRLVTIELGLASVLLVRFAVSVDGLHMISIITHYDRCANQLLKPLDINLRCRCDIALPEVIEDGPCIMQFAPVSDDVSNLFRWHIPLSTAKLSVWIIKDYVEVGKLLSELMSARCSKALSN